METQIESKIWEHLKESLILLDVGGASILNNRGLTVWLRKCFFTFAFTMTPLLQILDILHKDRDDLVPTLAFHLSSIWAVVITAVMILQGYRLNDDLIRSMMRVNEKQLSIGEVDAKLLKTVSKELNLKKNLTIILQCCLICIIFGGLFGWMLAFNLESFKQEFSQAMVKQYPFPLPLWFPVNYTKTKTRYLLAGTFAACDFLVVGVCLLGALTLFYSFTTFGTIHFMILKNFLETMHKRTIQKLKRINNTFSNEEYNNAMKEEFKKCVIYLGELLRYCNLIENTYSTILLVETICSGIAITGSLAMVVLTPINDSKFLTYAFIFGGCLEQSFLFCYFGDRLTQEAGNVRNALYFNEWVELDKSFKKSMLIVMIRLSKPVTITMGKVSPVQLTTFIQIVKSAYSFAALLQNSNAAVKG